MAAGPESRLLLVGAVSGAHGVHGRVKVKSFTQDPTALGSYGELTDETGRRRFVLRLTGEAGGSLVAEIEGIRNRDQAEALKGTALYLDRARLPEPEEEEYYHADLIGLRAETEGGAEIGILTAIQNWGAGDVIEVKTKDGGSLLYPFTRKTVPEIDLRAGKLTLVPPAEVEAGPEDKDEAEGKEEKNTRPGQGTRAAKGRSGG